MIEIAKVLKPQGLKGEIKIELFSKDLDAWSKLKKVYINNKEYNVESVRFYKLFGYIKLEELHSVEDAQVYRNKKLYAKREDFLTNSEEYLISDLENCTLVDESGNIVGYIDNIEKYGSADIINILINGQMKSFPFLKTVIKNVNVEDKKVVCYYDKLKEVLI